MKPYIFLVLSVFVFSHLNAQTLQVRVVDSNGEALPYASVYINGSHISATNSEGFSIIPFKKLTDGDTITSTYIGMNTSSIIFNKALKDLAKCTIVLKNDREYELDPIVVKAIANDDWKFFHKNARTHETFFYQTAVAKGKFNADILLSQDKNLRRIEGSFELKNMMPRKVHATDFYKYYFAELSKIETSVQDTAVKRRAATAIKLSINITCQVISRIHWERWNNSKYSKVKYLGLNDNHHYFRIVYTNKEFKDSLCFQTLVSVNKDNKEIEKVEYYAPHKVHSGSLERKKIISAVCKNIAYKKGKREATLTIPTEITYNGKVIDNSTIDMTLKGITFQIVN